MLNPGNLQILLQDLFILGGEIFLRISLERITFFNKRSELFTFWEILITEVKQTFTKKASIV